MVAFAAAFLYTHADFVSVKRSPNAGGSETRWDEGMIRTSTLNPHGLSRIAPMTRRHLTPLLSLCTLFSLTLLSRAVAGTDAPSKEWGSVPKEHFLMSSYPPDSNAAAVILFDIGEASFDSHYDLEFHRHTRIKILRKEGYALGTVKVSYQKQVQDIGDIEGQTLTLGPDGTIVRQELRGDDVFTEESGEKFKTAKFTLPALAPGSVIEYRYTIRSTNANYLNDWSFQNDEPTLWSEYELRTPNVFAYASVTQGYHKFFVQTSEQLKESFQGPAGMNIVPVSHSHWVMKDVPALREEPFITTLDDYRDRVSFQLSGVAWPGEVPQPILRTWDKVAEELRNHDRFGGQLDGSGSIRRVAESLSAGIADSAKRMETVYDFVRNSILWDGRHALLTRKGLDDVLEKKAGNSADINLLLTAMLRAAGLPAHPVLVSTRDNGRVVDVYPLVDQFNTVICQTSVGGRNVLLDATERMRPWPLLPFADLNHTGFLVGDEGYAWIPVEPTATKNALTFADMSLDTAGAIAGRVQMKLSDYAAVNERAALAEGKRDKFVSSLLKSSSNGINVDAFTITNADSVLLPLVVDATVSSGVYAQVLNDFIYVNPMTVARSMENPFKRNERLFPVDYAYPRSFTYKLNLKIPPGYALMDHPKDLTIQLPMNGAMYQRLSQQAENVFMLSVRFDLTQTSFPPEKYAALREFYERIVALESEQLVLQKQSSAAPAPTNRTEPAKARGRTKGKK